MKIHNVDDRYEANRIEGVDIAYDCSLLSDVLPKPDNA